MTVKEMIDKLQGMNPDAIVMDIEGFNYIDELSGNPLNKFTELNGISEIEESDDKKYVRVW